MGNFSTSQGPTVSGTKTERVPCEGDVPKTGFDQAPAGDRPIGGPGPGIPRNTNGWK